MKRKPSAIVQYKLRIRESLRRQIEKAAKQNEVSANAEMAKRLQDSFQQEFLAESETLVARMVDACGGFELVLATTALMAQIRQLPDEIQNQAEFKAALDRVSKALQGRRHVEEQYEQGKV
jgi:hypothetical protein